MRADIVRRSPHHQLIGADFEESVDFGDTFESVRLSALIPFK